MSQLDLLKKRAEYNSVINLKNRSFSNILNNSYNSETVYKIENLDKPLKVIIQTSKLSNRESGYSGVRPIDQKRISSPFYNNIKIGDVIYWERTKTNWLILLERTTEKNYFLGEMREANYLISWRDLSTGNEYSQLGTFQRGNGSLISEDILDFLEERATLILPKNSTTATLKRYDKFIIGRDVWEVQYIDTTTYKNMLGYTLRLTQWNKDLDTENLPNGQKNIINDIKTNFDYFTSVSLGFTKKIKIETLVNKKRIEDSYDISTTNCVYDKELETVLFNSLGDALISIKSLKTDKTKNFTIAVESEESVQKEYYKIAGPEKTKATLSYKYTIDTNEKNPIGEWRIESKNSEIIEQSPTECVVKMGKEYQQIKLSYLLMGEIKHSIIIEVKNLFDY